jgi:hypothetical protein
MGRGGPFFFICVMRVMYFMIRERVLQLIVCTYVAGYIVLGFAGGVVDVLDG